MSGRTASGMTVPPVAKRSISRSGASSPSSSSARIGDVVAVGVGDVDDGARVAVEGVDERPALIDRPSRPGPECVTAPRCAGPTSFAYFSSTPLSDLDRARLPRGAAARDLGVVEQERERAALAVDADAVAVAHERDRPAERRLRADVADHQAARRAREAPVGEERDLLAHALAVDERGDAEHLAHAGAAARPFVADDEHVAFGVGARGDRGEGSLPRTRRRAPGPRTRSTSGRRS